MSSRPLVSRAARALATAALLLAGLHPASLCAAQTNSGTLFGRVRDRAGRGLEGVRVQVVNEQSGNPRAKLTNAEGYFVIEHLRAGTYRINASREGFFPQTYERFPVQITVKNEVRIPDITLRQASVNGRVLDRAGRPLGGAKVVAAAFGARARGVAQTDGLGRFRIEDLSPGPYVITAAWAEGDARGLASEPLALDREETDAPPIVLAEVLRAGPARQGGPAPAPASDGGRAASLVRSVDAARVSNFSGRLFDAVPVGGATSMRSFDEFALLAAGVAPPPYTPGARGPGVGFGVGTSGQFSVNGMRARSNNFSVDGSDNNDPDVGVRRQGFVALVPQPVETVKDFSVATLLWDAELGRNFGAQVNAVSDYGGDAFHGQLYAFLTDSSLNARDFFDTGFAGRDPLTRTQFGFTFGGPVRRGRTHLFSSYERQQTNASVEQHFATPTQPERAYNNGQIFGAGLQGSTQYFGPFTDTTPLGRNVLSLYPLPNNPAGPYGANNYSQSLPSSGAGQVLSFKLTHQPRGESLLSGRYNFTDDRRTLPSVNRAVRSSIDAATRSHNLSLTLDSPFGQSFFNQARFSFGRTALDFFERPGSPYVFSAGSVESVPVVWAQPPVVRSSQTGPIGELVIEPFSPVGVGVQTFPQSRASNTFQYADTMSWSAGNHSVKFGGNVRRYQLNSRLDRFYRPQVVYGGAFNAFPAFTPSSFISGVELASLGVASSVLQTITAGAPDSTVGLRFGEYHFFINDNWRVHPRLTFDFGLRYEYNTVPVDAGGRIERALRLEGLPTAGGSRFDTPARTARFDAAVNAYREVLGGRTRIYDPDRNNFGPRAGLAWALDARGRTVLRVGYGVYFDTILGAVVSQSRNVFPDEIPINVDPSFLSFDVFNLNNPFFLALDRDAADNPVSPALRLLRPGACNQFGTCNQFGGAPEDFAALVGQLFLQNQSGGLAFTLPEKNLRTPYAQQWHLTFERELFGDYTLSVAYVGTKGTKLTRLTTPNRGPLVTPIISSLFVQVFRTMPGPQLANFPVIVSDNVRSGFIFNDDTTDCPPFPFPIIAGAPTPPLPSVPVCLQSIGRRSQGTLGAYQIIENSAGSNYHALQLEARKRYTRGFQFTAAYTYSHAIDDVSDLFPIAGAPILPQDSRNLRRERADANFDVRHRFASSFVWDLPFGRNSKGVAARVLGDWQLASVLHAHTGQPFTLNLPFDANLDGNLSDRPSTADGLIFLDGHGPRRVSLAPGRGPTDFTTSFQTPLPDFVTTLFVFHPTSIGRNTARGDAFVNLDLALSKRLSFTEGQTLLLRAEVFNALNRANFGLPVRVIGAPGFGSAVETAAPARTIQFAFKYAF